MSWIILFLAGLLEIGWAISMKHSEGFTKPLASVITVALIVLSLIMLNFAMKTLPVGTAYGVWAGIGTVGTAVVGILAFHEPANLPRLACIACIVVGIVGLRLLSEH